jgi:hypothetical protein
MWTRDKQKKCELTWCQRLSECEHVRAAQLRERPSRPTLAIPGEHAPGVAQHALARTRLQPTHIPHVRVERREQRIIWIGGRQRTGSDLPGRERGLGYDERRPIFVGARGERLTDGSVVGRGASPVPGGEEVQAADDGAGVAALQLLGASCAGTEREAGPGLRSSSRR